MPVDGSKRFAWLQLSDLFARKDFSNHLLARNSPLFDDLERRHTDEGPWHAVVITGDVAYSGQREEYTAADRLLQNLLARLREWGSDPVVLAVPGNHDLNRAALSPLAAAILARWDEDEPMRQIDRKSVV